MKFLDANIFLRFLVEPRTPADQPKQDATERLFLAIQAGEAAVTSELIVHEVLFILTSKRHYGYGKADAVAMLRPLLEFRAMTIPRKRLLIEAMAMYAEYRFLDFPDAMAIVVSREDSNELTSYDRSLSRVPGVVRFEP